MPLATKPATLAQLDLANWQGYARTSLVPHVVGTAIALLASLTLLLTFVAWRLVKLCACCACARGPRWRARKARALLAGGGSAWVKGAALCMAAGVLAGGVYGVTQVRADMVGPGLEAVSTVTGFIDGALAAGAATVAAVQRLDARLLAVQAGLVGLGPMAAGLVAPYTQASNPQHPQRHAAARRGSAARALLCRLRCARRRARHARRATGEPPGPAAGH